MQGVWSSSDLKNSSNKKIASGWSISRILSNDLRHLGNHLSGRCVTAPLGAAYPGLTQPTGGKGTYGDEQPPIVHRRNRPCLALLPAGVTWPHALLRVPVVSYTTFSPSPSPYQGWRAVCFCGPYPAGSRLSAVFPSTSDGISPPRVLSDAVLYRSADFPRSRQRRTAIARPA